MEENQNGNRTLDVTAHKDRQKKRANSISSKVSLLLRTDLKGYLYYHVLATREVTARRSAPPEDGTGLAWWPPRASPE